MRIDCNIKYTDRTGTEFPKILKGLNESTELIAGTHFMWKGMKAKDLNDWSINLNTCKMKLHEVGSNQTENDLDT